MTSGKFVSYLRVSTQKQGASGLGLEAQRKAVADYLNGGSWTLLREYVEIETGKRADRPELTSALAHCRACGATLIVAKLDRLARNVAFISALMEAGAEFVACDMPAVNRLTIHVLAAVAEHEAKMVSERTRAALAAAKARGVILGGARDPALYAAVLAPGRQRGNVASNAARRQKEADHRARVWPVIEAIRGEGITQYKAIAAELSRRGVLTARGGKWDATRVRNLILRKPVP
jgi:DNA invertase Pin-like site-specific DNA recombinase